MAMGWILRREFHNPAGLNCLIPCYTGIAGFTTPSGFFSTPVGVEIFFVIQIPPAWPVVNEVEPFQG